MCIYRYQYFASCGHEVITLHELCENAIFITTPLRGSGGDPNSRRDRSLSEARRPVNARYLFHSNLGSERAGLQDVLVQHLVPYEEHGISRALPNVSTVMMQHEQRRRAHSEPNSSQRVQPRLHASQQPNSVLHGLDFASWAWIVTRSRGPVRERSESNASYGGFGEAWSRTDANSSLIEEEDDELRGDILRLRGGGETRSQRSMSVEEMPDNEGSRHSSPCTSTASPAQWSREPEPGTSPPTDHILGNNAAATPQTTNPEKVLSWADIVEEEEAEFPAQELSLDSSIEEDHAANIGKDQSKFKAPVGPAKKRDRASVWALERKLNLQVWQGAARGRLGVSPDNVESKEVDGPQGELNGLSQTPGPRESRDQGGIHRPTSKIDSPSELSTTPRPSREPIDANMSRIAVPAPNTKFEIATGPHSSGRVAPWLGSSSTYLKVRNRLMAKRNWRSDPKPIVASTGSPPSHEPSPELPSTAFSDSTVVESEKNSTGASKEGRELDSDTLSLDLSIDQTTPGSAGQDEPKGPESPRTDDAVPGILQRPVTLKNDVEEIANAYAKPQGGRKRRRSKTTKDTTAPDHSNPVADLPYGDVETAGGARTLQDMSKVQSGQTAGPVRACSRVDHKESTCPSSPQRSKSDREQTPAFGSPAVETSDRQGLETHTRLVASDQSSQPKRSYAEAIAVGLPKSGKQGPKSCSNQSPDYGSSGGYHGSGAEKSKPSGVSGHNSIITSGSADPCGQGQASLRDTNISKSETDVVPQASKDGSSKGPRRVTWAEVARRTSGTEHVNTPWAASTGISPPKAAGHVPTDVPQSQATPPSEGQCPPFCSSPTSSQHSRGFGEKESSRASQLKSRSGDGKDARSQERLDQLKADNLGKEGKEKTSSIEDASIPEVGMTEIGETRGSHGIQPSAMTNSEDSGSGQGATAGCIARSSEGSSEGPITESAVPSPCLPLIKLTYAAIVKGAQPASTKVNVSARASAQPQPTISTDAPCTLTSAESHNIGLHSPLTEGTSMSSCNEFYSAASSFGCGAKAPDLLPDTLSETPRDTTIAPPMPMSEEHVGKVSKVCLSISSEGGNLEPAKDGGSRAFQCRDGVELAEEAADSSNPFDEWPMSRAPLQAKDSVVNTCGISSGGCQAGENPEGTEPRSDTGQSELTAQVQQETSFTDSGNLAATNQDALTEAEVMEEGPVLTQHRGLREKAFEMRRTSVSHEGWRNAGVKQRSGDMGCPGYGRDWAKAGRSINIPGSQRPHDSKQWCNQPHSAPRQTPLRWTNSQHPIYVPQWMIMQPQRTRTSSLSSTFSPSHRYPCLALSRPPYRLPSIPPRCRLSSSPLPMSSAFPLSSTGMTRRFSLLDRPSWPWPRTGQHTRRKSAVEVLTESAFAPDYVPTNTNHSHGRSRAFSDATPFHRQLPDGMDIEEDQQQCHPPWASFAKFSPALKAGQPLQRLPLESVRGVKPCGKMLFECAVEWRNMLCPRCDP